MKNGNDLLHALNQQGNPQRQMPNNQNYYHQAYQNTSNRYQNRQPYSQQNFKYNSALNNKVIPQMTAWPLHSKIIVGVTQFIFFALVMWYLCTVHFVDSMHPILSFVPLIMIAFSVITEPGIFSYDKGRNLEKDSFGLLVIVVIAVALNYVCYQF